MIKVLKKNLSGTKIYAFNLLRTKILQIFHELKCRFTKKNKKKISVPNLGVLIYYNINPICNLFLNPHRHITHSIFFSF